METNGLTAVNCARPGPHGNPFLIGPDCSAKMACFLHRQQLVGGLARLSVEQVRAKLRGRNLACFCKLESKDCHVDTLLEVANEL